MLWLLSFSLLCSFSSAAPHERPGPACPNPQVLLKGLESEGSLVSEWITSVSETLNKLSNDELSTKLQSLHQQAEGCGGLWPKTKDLDELSLRLFENPKIAAKLAVALDALVAIIQQKAVSTCSYSTKGPAAALERRAINADELPKCCICHDSLEETINWNCNQCKIAIHKV
jgi:hypothetical protein